MKGKYSKAQKNEQRDPNFIHALECGCYLTKVLIFCRKLNTNKSFDRDKESDIRSNSAFLSQLGFLSSPKEKPKKNSQFGRIVLIVESLSPHAIPIPINME